MADLPLDVTAWRRQYHNKDEPVLLEQNLPTKNPFNLFDHWFKNVSAQNDISLEETNAVCISTVSSDGQPSSRMVLMRGYGPNGFVIHTNYNSRKGKEIAQNNKVALLFHWPSVHRQVRIEGKANFLGQEENDAYWYSRPVANRIGSTLSEQSTVIASRQVLLDKKTQLEKLAAEQGDDAIKRPAHWGGIRITPQLFEFWQGQSDRVHDRIVFAKNESYPHQGDDGWFYQRLSP